MNSSSLDDEAILLDDEDINDANAAYEAQCGRRGIAPDSGPEADRVLTKLDLLYPGFREYRKRRAQKVAEEIETFQMASRLRSEGVRVSWYRGPLEHSGFWPEYKTKIQASLSAAAVEDLDKSTTQILDACANPQDIGSKRKGLVVGYVQSGKTANFEGLIAKAADAGYRVIIVMAGMFNNLREQTQSRLAHDLGLEKSSPGSASWSPLTDVDNDFGGAVSRTILNLENSVAIAVVKKNNSVLKKLIRWLNSIDAGLLAKRPVLIIDDEADQATPNTEKRRDEISTINKRVRELWRTVGTGTYVAYTATPFANVFIDPDDPADMYPDDFIFTLPEPNGYMGASAFFNLEMDADKDSDRDLALATEVSDIEAAVLTPRPPNIEDYDPHVTESLEEAIRWFIAATAVRQLRRGPAHSTMLVHTSHRVLAHKKLADVIRDYVRDLHRAGDGEASKFKEVFDRQMARTLSEGAHIPEWHEIWDRISTDVLPHVSVVVENGMSDERLAYGDDAQTVIAVGGSTLSRGMTLEGLVTSYFLRTSANYDTLLQMGRWFGYRIGYDDLVRIWVAPGLLEEFAHLSRVEEDMRERIAVMSEEDKTPREMAIPILAHDGRLSITSSNRMAAVREVQVGLSGSRRQTVYLDRSPSRIRESHRAARHLAQDAIDHASGQPLRERRSRPSILFQNVPSSDFLHFLEGYWVSESDRWLQPENLRSWLNKYGRDVSWNVVLVSGSDSSGATFDYADGLSVAPVLRTPLREDTWKADKRLPDRLSEDSDVINIRALISGSHQVLDLKILNDNGRLTTAQSADLAKRNASSKKDARILRKSIAPNVGLVLLYVIDKDSRPLQRSKERGAMDAVDHLIGLAVIFPDVDNEDPREYYAVEVSTDIDVLTEEERALEQFEMLDENAYFEAEAEADLEVE